MKTLKLVSLAAGLMTAALLAACTEATDQATSPATPRATAPAPSEIAQPAYLFEVVRYLYRWHFDEAEVQRIEAADRCIFWVYRLDVPLDAGDRSIEANIVLPQLGITVRVKKADYTIQETALVVKSPRFEVQEVTRAGAGGGGITAQPPKNSQVVSVDTSDMRDHLFRTRNQNDYPDAALLEHLRAALRQEVLKLGLDIPVVGEQIVHLAPLSPVSDEVWVYWENGHKLFYFSSDIDLNNPALWDFEPLMVHIYDLNDQVVVSEQEAGSSNLYLTRYQVGRTLYNCMVLGERVTLTPPAASQP